MPKKSETKSTKKASSNKKNSPKPKDTSTKATKEVEAVVEQEHVNETQAEDTSWADKMEGETKTCNSKTKDKPTKDIEKEVDTMMENDEEFTTLPPRVRVVKHLTYPEGSVANFDRTKVIELSKKSVKELSNTQLLQVLVWRGEVELNPFLTNECVRTLQKLHHEVVPSFKKFPHKKFNNNFDNSNTTRDHSRSKFNNGKREHSKSKFSNGNYRPYRK